LIAQIIKHLNWNVSPYCALLLFFIPNYPLVLNSGLTEPLYASVLILTVYFFVIEKYGWAAVAVSFLPFVRSEGFISITVVAVIFLLLHKWRIFPLFLVGTIIISIAGYIFYHDQLLWVYTTIPYTEERIENYGSGGWTDFFPKFYYMTGIPFTILFWISVCLIVFLLIKRIRVDFKGCIRSVEFLFLGLFFSFFLAHVVFWRFGLFHSFGMSRVLICILPIAFLMIMYLLNELMQKSFKFKKEILVVICILIIVFPFLSNKSSWNIPADFVEDPEIVAIKNIKSEFNIDSLHASKIYYTSIPLMTVLNYDVYDTDKFKSIRELKTSLPTNEKILLIKEDWFLYIDENMSSDDPVFKQLKKVYSKKISENNTVEMYTNF